MAKPVTSWTPAATPPATSWTPVAKTATPWGVNSAYSPNPYPYDSASHTYDSAVDTYDGVVAGQSPVSTKPATSWSKA